MRNRVFIIILILAVFIAGCARPQKEDLRPDWDAAWFRMGDQLAVEAVPGFELNESNDVLSISGLYYATWTSGTGRDITNPQGREAVVYDAQLYLLLKMGKSEDGSKADISDWIKRESESYEAGEEKTVTANGQDYILLPLLAAKSENPYDHGIAVFALRGANAVTAEFLCTEDYSGDAEEIILAFLDGIHY